MPLPPKKTLLEELFEQTDPRYATHAQGSKADSAVQSISQATTSTFGTLKMASKLVKAAPTTITNNTGGTLIITGILPAIVGALYATDAALLKNSIATLIVGQNTMKDRLEELIANLKASGHLES